MRIAMITPQWTKTVGGVTNYVLNLARQLEARQHEVNILTCEEGSSALFFHERLVRRELEITKRMCELRPHIIHIHGRVHYIPPAIIYKRLFDCKTRIIFTFYTQPHFRPFLQDSQRLNLDYGGSRRILARMLLRMCDHIVSVSENLVENLNRHCRLGISQYAVIPSGGTPKDVDAGELLNFKKAKGLTSCFPVLSSVGVFSWDWKVAGHMIAMEAVAILQKKYPRIRLLVAGEGPYASVLINFASKLNVQENVLFCGFRDKALLVLGASDIYVHMALNEASPLSVIEAMLACKPIIAANRGGIPEIIANGETGLLIEPDPNILAQAIEDLVRDPAKHLQMARQAFSHVSQKFDWGLISERYLALYSGHCFAAD